MDSAQHLWLQTFLVLAGTVAGFFLHLRWHPLRDLFREAAGLLKHMRWIVLGGLVLLIFADADEPWAIPKMVALWEGHTVKDQMIHLWPRAGLDLSILLHGLWPAWPLVLMTPFIVSWAALNLWRASSRQSSRRKRRRTSGHVFALVLSLVAWFWLMLELLSWAGLWPVGGDFIRVSGRWIMEAWTMAACQVVLIQYAITLKQSGELDERRVLAEAMEHVMMRWRGVLSLAFLDLLWLMAWRHLERDPGGFKSLLIVEASILFSAGPVVVACVQGSMTQLIAGAMKGFIAAALPLIAGAVTALAMIVLAHFSVQNLWHLAGESQFWGWGVRIFAGLVLATLHSWLFLAFVLILLRHGLTAFTRSRGAN